MSAEQQIFLLGNDDDSIRVVVMQDGGFALNILTGEQIPLNVAMIQKGHEEPRPLCVTRKPVKVMALEIAAKMNLTILNMKEELTV